MMRAHYLLVVMAVLAPACWSQAAGSYIPAQQIPREAGQHAGIDYQ